MERATADRLSGVLRDAAAAGAPLQEVRTQLGKSVVETPGITHAWETIANTPDQGLVALRKELTDCRVVDERAVDNTLKALERRFTREIHNSVEVVTDSEGLARTWWPARTATKPGPRERHGTSTEPDRGRVVLMGVTGAQLGEGNHQLTVFVREVKDPQIDFEKLTKNPDVATKLADLSADPTDADARQAAVDALTSVQRQATDWTTVYSGTGSAILGSGAPKLDGTVAIARSRSVQVGDYNYQENSIQHTVSLRIAANVLLQNPDVVNGLIDIACAPGDADAMARFQRAINGTIESDLANSAVSRRGHGTVHRPPKAGKTLRISNMAAVSVGKRVSQKTEFAQTAHLGRNLQKSSRRVARDVRKRRSTVRSPNEADGDSTAGP
jgi:hypothetical protein